MKGKIRGAALTVRFVLELCLVASVGVIAWETASSGWNWVLAALAIVAVTVIWGLCLSPKAAVTLPGWAALLIESALFLGAGIGLWLLGFEGRRAWRRRVGRGQGRSGHHSALRRRGSARTSSPILSETLDSEVRSGP